MLKQKQPRGFSTFFLTEMWERYGFYVLQSLLVFYGLQKLHLNDTETYTIVGSFTALAYISSVLGGLIADRYIGYDKAILSGAVLLCIGYSILTIATNKHLFGLGLAIVTMGTGMLKPNISSMLSMLYQDKPQQKEVGYTLFYVGIYFGAISGSFIGGYIKSYFGWHAVFASAAIGLAISFTTFYFGRRRYNLCDNRPINASFLNHLKGLICILILTSVAYMGIINSMTANILFAVVSILSIFFLVKNILSLSGNERKKLIAFCVLTLFSVLFWAVYFQQFFSVSLCASRVAKLTLPESSLSAFVSLGIIIFGPLLNIIWLKLQKNDKDLSITAKFSLSFLCNSLGFLILILSLNYAISNNMLQNQIFIIISYLIIALGELFISPIGLSMVSSLVPQRLNGAMTGIFLMSIGFGGKLAGVLAQISVIDNSEQNITNIQILYRNSFGIYLAFSLIVFILCLLAIRPINKLIKGN